jgi:hypothetical protein
LGTADRCTPASVGETTEVVLTDFGLSGREFSPQVEQTLADYPVFLCSTKNMEAEFHEFSCGLDQAKKARLQVVVEMVLNSSKSKETAGRTSLVAAIGS